MNYILPAQVIHSLKIKLFINIHLVIVIIEIACEKLTNHGHYFFRKFHNQFKKITFKMRILVVDISNLPPRKHPNTEFERNQVNTIFFKRHVLI